MLGKCLEQQQLHKWVCSLLAISFVIEQQMMREGGVLVDKKRNFKLVQYRVPFASGVILTQKQHKWCDRRLFCVP